MEWNINKILFFFLVYSVPRDPVIQVGDQVCTESIPYCAVAEGDSITCSVNGYRPNTTLSLSFEGPGLVQEVVTEDYKDEDGYTFFDSSVDIITSVQSESKYTCSITTAAFTSDTSATVILKGK